jgi:hypothetical protein
MESGELQDNSITASSYTTPPSLARLNHPDCWCAEESDGSWLQVDLKAPHYVTSVATQGNPLGNKDFVKKYKLQYSKDGGKWTNHEESGNQVGVWDSFFASREPCNTVAKMTVLIAVESRFTSTLLVLANEISIHLLETKPL